MFKAKEDIIKKRMFRRASSKKKTRLLSLEQLEDRRLLTLASWHNFLLREDVNGDNFVTPLDALLIINELNTTKYGAPGTGRLPIPGGADSARFGMDISCDGFVSPIDALRVINALNAQQFTSGLKFTSTGGYIQPSKNSPNGSCAPRLVESNSFGAAISADFIVPSAPSALEIQFSDLSFDITDDFINDAFEAALVDERGTSLVHKIAGSRDAFFNITEGQSARLGANTLYSGDRLKVDIAHVAPGTKAKLVLRLVNNDGDESTSVQISNFQVISGALGTPAGVPGAAASLLQTQAAIDFDRLTDVTSSISAEYGLTSFEPKGNLLQADLALRNAGGYALNGPIVAVIDHLSDPSIRVSNADGFTPEGRPYFNLNWNANRVFQSNDVTASRQLLFKNPNAIQFTYDVVVFGQLNHPPAIISQAITEAIVGREYRYPILAQDPDNDPLSYSLLVGPTSMVLDGNTLKWTAPRAVGSQAVVLRVADGRGGMVDQQFTLNVIDPPPNRPPLFVSTPVVDANIGSLYSYAAGALDPDGDTLSFTLVDGPAAMQVDAQTGRISWTPEETTRTWDAARDFAQQVNPAGEWTYGWTAGLGSGLNVFPNRRQVEGLDLWDDPAIVSAGAPSVAHNGTDRVIRTSLNIEWQPGQLSFHPGERGQHAVVRWTAPITGNVRIAAAFGNLDLQQGATTDVYVLHNGATLFTGTVNRFGSQAQLAPRVRHVAAGDTIDFVVGVGSGGYSYDTTSLAASITATGLNAVPVTIGVADDQGASATQSFLIDVQPAQGNHPPTIISTPATELLALATPLTLPPAFTSRVVTTLQPQQAVVGMALSGDGKLYFSSADGGPIYQRDMASGTVSILKSTGLSGHGRMVVAHGGAFGTDLLHADHNAGGNFAGTVFRTNRMTGESTALLVGAVNRTVQGDPFGIALGRGGAFGNDLYIMDFQGATFETPLLERISPSGQVTVFAEGGPWTAESLPLHVELSPGGDFGDFLYVGDLASKKIWRVDPNGQISEFSTQEVLTPHSLRFAPGGPFGNLLYVLEGNGRIVRVDAQGTVLPFSESLAAVEAGGDMIFDPAGQHLYVGIKDNVYEVTPSTNIGYTYDVHAVDGDGDALTYSLEEGPAGMAFDAKSSRVVWNPTQAQVGSHNVVVHVDDGRGGSAFQEFAVAVGTRFATANGGSIRGTVYDDTNANGQRDDVVPRATVDVRVPGTADPYLAGMPDGSRADGGDVAPAQSPTSVVGLSPLASGSALTFSAQGNVHFSGQASTDGPDGALTFFVPHAVGAENGISQVNMPANALLGVFLGPDLPNASPPPAGLDFRVGGNVPGGIDFLTLAPQLKQIFFIGDGVTQDGVTQRFTIPSRATRLFLGAMDGTGWYNNGGMFTVSTTLHAPISAGLPGRTVYLDSNDNAEFDAGEVWTVTDAQGDYTFTSLTAGTYVVRLLPRSGTKQSAPNVNLLANGNFEDGPHPGSFTNVQAGSMFIPGWDVTQGSVDLLGGLFDPADGTNAVEVNGAVPGAIAQTFATIPGKAYALTFDLAGNPAGNPATKSLHVTAAGATMEFTFDSTGSGARNMGYEHKQWTFTATAATTTLEFRAAENSVYGPIIDRISVSEVLAQPAAASNHPHRVSLANNLAVSGVDFGSVGSEILGPNRNPIVSSTPITTIGAGETYIYRVVAGDPDFDALTFDLPVRPAGMAVHTTRGVVTWTPQLGDVGTYDVILRVRDGRGGVALQSFRVEVEAANNAPQITSIPPGPATPDRQYRYAVRAQDADGDVLTYRLTGGRGNMTIAPETGLLSWTPASGDVGTHRFTITVTDARGSRASQTFDLTVSSSPNRNPRILSEARTQARLGDPYVYNVDASDPDGDPLTIELTTAASGMSLDASGMITWTPTGSQFGPNPVAIKIIDGRGGEATQTFTIEVRSLATNRAPVIVTMPPIAATVGVAYGYDVDATDADGDTLAYSLPRAPAGMSIDPLTGEIRWRPTDAQLGPQSVEVQVADMLGKTATQEFTVTVRGSNLPPQITSVPRTTATSGFAYEYPVAAHDPEGGPLTYFLTQGIGNLSVNQAGVISWLPDDGELGPQLVTLRVTDRLGAFTEQSFTVVVAAQVNTPPDITSLPGHIASVGDLYAYQVRATDAEGATLRFELRAGPGGMSIDESTGLVRWTPDQPLSTRVVVAAVDPLGGVSEQTFTLVALPPNQQPMITSVAPAPISAGAKYRYDVRANDPDGDRLSFRLDAGPAGMAFDDFGRLTWSTTAADIGSHHVQLSVHDGRGGAAVQEFDIAVAADIRAPQVQVQVGANPANLGSPLLVVVSAVDDVGVTALRLTVGGQTVPLDSMHRASVPLTAAGNLAIVATATDAASNSGQATTSVLVIDPNITEAPTVDLMTPEDNATVTAPTDVIGTVQDANLVSWKLEVAPFDSGVFTQIATGTTAVANGVLGKFDPTLLQNDSYILRLTATNAGGLSSSVETIVNVAGELKLGNFTLSFTDLSIPVSGIPITIKRTYDTLTANQDGELGYGWRLEFRDVDLRTSLPKTGSEDGGIYASFRDGTRIYVTLPGGKREGFTFRPKAVALFDPHQRERDVGPEVQSGNGFNMLYFVPSFVPDKGVTNQLTVPRFQLSKQGHEYFQFGGGLPYNPEDPSYGARFTLTSKEGVSYRVDASTKQLASVADLNGNSLSFSQSQIASSTGSSVLFNRDANGRITGVTDPLGNSLRYQYDSTGDLISTTDRRGNTTQFRYHDTRPHYLVQQIDTLGNVGLRMEYDDSGRLMGVGDATGQTTGLSVDSNHRTERVTDAFGNSSINEYDERGNTITTIDALGNIFRRTFDDDNNVTSITDPLGNKYNFLHDANGNILSESNPLGNTTHYTYDQAGRLLSTTGPAGATTVATYDERGNVLTVHDGLGGVTRALYDSAGNGISVTGPDGPTQELTYDSQGRVVRSTGAMGDVRSFIYDANGNRLSETQVVSTPTGMRTVVTSYTYDVHGNTTSVTGPDGDRRSTEFDALGRVKAETDPLGQRTAYEYDARGKRISTTYPDGSVARSSYDAAGRLVSRTDREGRTTTFVLDALGRIIEVVSSDATPDDQSDNPRVRTEYDALGRIVAEVDALGNRTEKTYDAAGQLLRIRDPLGNLTSYQYDAEGHVAAETDALGRTTRFVYDALGRTLKVIYADGTSTSTSFSNGKSAGLDSVGAITGQTDEEGHTVLYSYDAAGRLTSSTDAIGGKTEYSYDEAGNLILQRDANGHATRYEYNARGLRTATTLPLDQRSTTSYDAVGRVASRIDFNGQQIDYTYAINGQMESKRLPDANRTLYSYTPSLDRATVTDARGVTSYVYDAVGRLVSVTSPDGQAIVYGYDKAGQRTSMTTAAGTTTTTYDSLGRKSTVTGPDAGVTRLTYDAVGNLIRTELPNGNVESRTYDLRNRLLTVEVNGPSGLLAGHRYTLSASGKRLTSLDVISGHKVTYSYDALGRLTSEIMADASTVMRTITYRYDAVGNRTQRNDSGEGITEYTYDDNDRLLTATLNGQLTRFTYDNNGNELTRASSPTDQTATTWDAENRLVSADITGASGLRHLAFTYDTDGNRVAQTVEGVTTHYLVDTQDALPQVVMEYTQGGLVTVAYVRGDRLLSETRGGANRFYLVDGLGSTIAIADAAGAVLQRFSYDAFGRQLVGAGAAETSFGFAGEQSDPTLGWSYMRARYYDPNLGSFTSRDPFDGYLTEPITRQKYLYAGGDPVNHVDPSGKTFTLVQAAGLVAGLALTQQLYKAASVRLAGNVLSPQHTSDLQRILTDVQQWLEKMVDADPRTLNYFFGAVNETQKGIVAANWQTLQNKVSSDAVAGVVFREYRLPLKGPYVPADTQGFLILPIHRIRFFPSFWTLDTAGNHTQRDALIHELTHALVGTIDTSYGLSDARRLPPAKAIRNADNYALQALFVNDPDKFRSLTGDQGPF